MGEEGEIEFLLFLLKGHVRKNWKVRFFIVEAEYLQYYIDGSKNNMKGSVSLKKATVQQQASSVKHD